jgi:hypothetical protein
LLQKDKFKEEEQIMIFILLVVVAAFVGGVYLESRINVVTILTNLYTAIVADVKGVITAVKNIFAKKS